MQFVMRNGSETVLDVEIEEGSHVYTHAQGKGEPVFAEWDELTREQQEHFLSVQGMLEEVFTSSMK